jgi:hypothetical protein
MRDKDRTHTVVLVDATVICMLSVSQVEPFRSAHSDLEIFHFVRGNKLLEALELIFIERFAALQLASADPGIGLLKCLV